MKKSRIENLPFLTIILFSTWLNMKELAQLTCASRELFWIITGMNLKSEEHANALTELSRILKSTAPISYIPFFRTKIPTTTLAEFIVTRQRQYRDQTDIFIKNCTEKIGFEIGKHNYKVMCARNGLIELFQAPICFLMAVFIGNRASCVISVPVNFIILLCSGMVATNGIHELLELFQDRKMPVESKQKKLLENTVMPAVSRIIDISNS